MNLPFAHPPLPHGVARLPLLLSMATFPIYGLIEKPQGLTLRSVGYTRAFVYASEQEILQRVTLGFVGYGVGYRSSIADRSGRTFGLTTTHPAGLVVDLRATPSPVSSPPPDVLYDVLQLPPNQDIYDVDGRRYTRYSSVEEALQDTSVGHSCLLIERFPLGQEVVVAELRRYTRPTPQWAFSLRGPGLRISGQAGDSSSSELLRLVGHLGALNEHPDVVAQYQREIAAWQDGLH